MPSLTQGIHNGSLLLGRLWCRTRRFYGRIKATKPLVDQIKNSTGLENGGKWIGQLERALTFFFMLTGQTGAIGFLFAAKSILRFGEIKEPDQRKETEYIIIGTFMSFGWALLTAYLTKQALGLWSQNIAA